MSTRRQSPQPRPPQPSGDIGELPAADLLDGIGQALREPHPLALLTMASGIAAALDSRGKHPLAPEPTPDLPTLGEFCDTLIEAGFRETDALLLALGPMTGDELLLRRIKRAVAGRRHPIPTWLLRLDEVTPYRTIETTHVLSDGDNVIIGVRLPGGRECSILVYIDHNMGTLVKDAFALDRPIAEVVDAWANADPMADATIDDLASADARARVTAAIERGLITFPPFETDTWPGIRAFTEWIVAMLPAGGTGYVRPEWSQEQLSSLTDEFFAAQVGRPLDDEDNRSLLESILWFGTDYGPGDPLRWSPVSVEILLDDWLPRKVVAPAGYLSKAPRLLRAFIRYCHAERGISHELTEQTLDAVDAFEPSYQEAIRAPRRQGPMALLERIGAMRPLDDDTGAGAQWPYSEWDEDATEQDMLDLLASTVGGADELESLSADPLPDEPMRWEAVPTDIRSRVGEVADLVDGCCKALFDIEFRTAGRRLLSRIAAGDPAIFRRRSSVVTAAAAVCWIIGRANSSFAHYGQAGLQVKDLMAHFGLTGSLSQRAEVMLRAIGSDWRNNPGNLGDAALLVSRERAEIIELRDLYDGHHQA